MRFPLSLTRNLAAYLLKKRWSGQTRFPLVLMLEPLHACNLSCSGCGRIREYASTLRERLSLEECLGAVDECGAPVVSVCGGEPLIYPEIGSLVDRIVARGKHVYLCTNGLRLAEMVEEFRPSSHLFINVHLDGMEVTHDRIVQRQGVFREAIGGLQAAKRAGFQVCTNTTVYQQTDMNEIVVLLEYLSQLGVDGCMVSPAYGYEAVRAANPEEARGLFLTRADVHAKFRPLRNVARQFRLVTSPIYLDFLCGDRELACAAWASPTRNVRGWKGPCYLTTDAHYASYEELLRTTDWDRLGPGGDLRCRDCLVHCGFEPAAALAANASLRDAFAMAVWQLG